MRNITLLMIRHLAFKIKLLVSWVQARSVKVPFIFGPQIYFIILLIAWKVTTETFFTIQYNIQ